MTIETDARVGGSPEPRPDAERPWRRWLFVALCCAAALAGVAVAVQAVQLASGLRESQLTYSLPFAAASQAGGQATAQDVLAARVTLPISYVLPVRFGQVGPQLVAAGALDPKLLADALAQGTHPLTPEQLALVEQGGSAPVTMDASNAQFLLDFLWAIGLANRNPILLEGPMQKDGAEGAMRFASTAGWTLAAKPVAEVYAALPLTTLTVEQQKRLETVAAAAYRPCCNNATRFPDCNHGMALLGLLELMAADNATEQEMFDAAKYVNAFWFPTQMAEAATLVKLREGVDFADADARELVGSELFSAAGAQATHAWLTKNGYLPVGEGEGASCGV